MVPAGWVALARSGRLARVVRQVGTKRRGGDWGLTSSFWRDAETAFRSRAEKRPAVSCEGASRPSRSSPDRLRRCRPLPGGARFIRLAAHRHARLRAWPGCAFGCPVECTRRACVRGWLRWRVRLGTRARPARLRLSVLLAVPLPRPPTPAPPRLTRRAHRRLAGAALPSPSRRAPRPATRVRVRFAGISAGTTGAPQTFASGVMAAGSTEVEEFLPRMG